ncbi:MAG: DUF2505 family protein [Leptospiraceae bacterium]|nr:DUF2505 family protein [Leptospiraceae bacterium]MDW7976637.1 DUF2505 family protein [Leptospiraceae bacterium]
MKLVEIEQEFPVPLELLLKARQERYDHLDKFPELKNVKIIKEEKDNHKLFQVRHISIGTNLPSVLVQVLPKGADTLVEESEFDFETNVHKFKVVPFGNLDHLFLIEGESIYEKKDENHSKRKYRIQITSKVFLLGAAIEAAIAEIYTNSLKKDQESINHFIEMFKTQNA